MGMLSLSAKTVNLSARPSPSVSSQMRMRSRPSPLRLQFVRIVDRLADPEPAALVPVHADRLAPSSGSAANSFDFESPAGVTRCFIDSSGRDGFCILPSGSLVAPALLAGGIERHVGRRRIRTASRPSRAAVIFGPDRRIARHDDRIVLRPPSECRARPGCESRDCPRSAHRGPRRCRRRGPCPACEPRSTAPCPSLSSRYSSTVRSFSLCFVWT